MLLDVRLFRRHSGRCIGKQNKEDVLDRCDCNLGYKGIDPSTRKFRRLMFIPSEKEIQDAWRAVVEIEQGKVAPVVSPEPPQQRIPIREAYDKYLNIVRQRNVKEASIYSMFRPVGNAVVRLAESKGLKYLDEIDESFGPDLMASFQHLTVNVRDNYRGYFHDFSRIAKKHKWTALNLSERIEIPARGKRRTAPVNPTEPFDAASELPRIMAAIPRLELGGVSMPTNRKPLVWRQNVETAKALLLVLRYTGLRISDAILFEPRSLEKKKVRDENGKEHEVYARWVRKQKKTDTPVFVVIPLEVGEFIMKAPRLSEEHAFMPSGVQFRSWVVNTTTVLFKALEAASGVQHIHAHRFRDTVAVELYRKTKDINFVSRAIGHASVMVTIKHYSHFLREDQDEAVRKMIVGWSGASGVPGIVSSLQAPDQPLHG